MKKLILVLLFATPALARVGGSDVGNGGDAVVCRYADQSIRTAELLDFYEARVLRGQKIDLQKSKSMDQNVRILLQRMGVHDTYLREKTQAWYNSFMSEAAFLKGTELVDIPDSNHITVPTGCKVEQVAIQKKPQFAGEKYYTINKDIWDKLDSVSQAGLVLHELLYRNQTERYDDLGDSTYVRYFNSLVAANELKAMAYRDYLQFVSLKLYIPFTNIKGYLVSIDQIRYDDAGVIKSFFYHFRDKEVFKVADDLEFTMSDKSWAHVEILEDRWRIGFEYHQKTLVYDGLNFSIPHVGLRLEFDVDPAMKTLLGIIGTYPLEIDVRSPYDLTSLFRLKCAQVQFRADVPELFKCIPPEHTKWVLGEALDNLVVKKSNLALHSVRGLDSKEGTKGSEARFYSDGMIQKILCLSHAPKFFNYVKNANNNYIFLKMEKEFTLENVIMDNKSILQMEVSCRLGDTIEFARDGKIMKGGIVQIDMREVNHGVARFTFGGHSEHCPGNKMPDFDLYPTGQVRAAVAYQMSYPMVPFTDASGNLVKVNAGDVVRFDPDGSVRRVDKGLCAKK